MSEDEIWEEIFREWAECPKFIKDDFEKRMDERENRVITGDTM